MIVFGENYELTFMTSQVSSSYFTKPSGSDTKLEVLMFIPLPLGKVRGPGGLEVMKSRVSEVRRTGSQEFIT